MDKPVMAGVIEILATLPSSPFSTSCRIYENKPHISKKARALKTMRKTEVRIIRLKSMCLD